MSPDQNPLNPIYLIISINYFIIAIGILFFESLISWFKLLQLFLYIIWESSVSKGWVIKAKQLPLIKAEIKLIKILVLNC